MFLLVEYVISYKLKDRRILMNYNKEICPKEFCEYFLFTTIFIFLSGCVMFYNKNYVSSFFVFALVFTSINFWRKPRFDYRRTIDMTMCKIISLFFLINTLYFHEFNRVFYHCVLLSLIIFNIIENVLWHFDSNKWIIFHLAVHIYMAYFSIFIYYVL